MGRRVFEKDVEFGNRGFEVVGFEESETELAVERDGLFVMILTGFEEAEVGIGFGVGGVGLEEGAPCCFGLGEFALLLEREGGLA